MQIKYYKTEWEDKTTDRYEMLADLIAKTAQEFPLLKPRVLNVTERSYAGYGYLSAILVWE